MKQVFHCKGSTVDSAGARQTTVPFEDFYEFDGTKLRQFPVPSGSVLSWGSELDSLAERLAAEVPSSDMAEVDAGSLAGRRRAGAELRAAMVGVQEELDWRCLGLYGVTAKDLSLPPEDAPALSLGDGRLRLCWPGG